MDFIVALTKKMPIVPIALFIGGLMVGLLIGWVIAPVEFVDATPAYLRADLQEDYMRMAIDSYSVNKNADLAVQRWMGLGEGAQQAYANVQANPNGVDPAAIQAYGQVVTTALASQPPPVEDTSSSVTPKLTDHWRHCSGVGCIGCGRNLSLSFIGQARQR